MKISRVPSNVGRTTLIITMTDLEYENFLVGVGREMSGCALNRDDALAKGSERRDEAIRERLTVNRCPCGMDLQRKAEGCERNTKAY